MAALTPLPDRKFLLSEETAGSWLVAGAGDDHPRARSVKPIAKSNGKVRKYVTMATAVSDSKQVVMGIKAA